MGQIIKNYTLIFIAPFLIGCVVRFLCRHIKRAYLVTLAFIAIAIVGWTARFVVPTHGSELYGIIALIATSMAIGALLTGLIVRTKNK